MGGGDTCCGFAGCGRAGEELALSEAEREAKRTEYAAAAAERVTKRGTATTSGLDGRVEVCDGDPRVMGLSRAMVMWSYGVRHGDRWPVGEWNRVTLDGFEVDGAKLSAMLIKEYGRHPMDPSAVYYQFTANRQGYGAYWLRQDEVALAAHRIVEDVLAGRKAATGLAVAEEIATSSGYLGRPMEVDPREACVRMERKAEVRAVPKSERSVVSAAEGRSLAMRGFVVDRKMVRAVVARNAGQHPTRNGMLHVRLEFGSGKAKKSLFSGWMTRREAQWVAHLAIQEQRAKLRLAAQDVGAGVAWKPTREEMARVAGVLRPGLALAVDVEAGVMEDLLRGVIRRWVVFDADSKAVIGAGWWSVDEMVGNAEDVGVVEGIARKRARRRRKALPMVSDSGDDGESSCVIGVVSDAGSSSSSSESSSGMSSGEYREWKRRKFLEAIRMPSREEVLRMHVGEGKSWNSILGVLSEVRERRRMVAEYFIGGGLVKVEEAGQ